MRHGITHRQLGRSSSHRRALLRNLVSALIEHEQIKTTVPKAKETKRVAEKLITMAKRALKPEEGGGGGMALKERNAKRRLLTYIRTPATVLPKLMTGPQCLGLRYQDRAGGYTRLKLLGHRTGDYAPMAVLELVGNPRDLRWAMTIRSEAKRAFDLEREKQEGDPLSGVRTRALRAQNPGALPTSKKDKVERILTTNFRKAWKSMNHVDGSQLLSSIEARLQEMRLEATLPTAPPSREWAGLMGSRRAGRAGLRSMPTLWPRKGLKGRHPWLGPGEGGPSEGGPGEAVVRSTSEAVVRSTSSMASS